MLTLECHNMYPMSCAMKISDEIYWTANIYFMYFYMITCVHLRIQNKNPEFIFVA